MAELLVCLTTGNDGRGAFERGDLVEETDPRVTAHPELFAAWLPPPVELPHGGRVRDAMVVTESFATGDRTLLRGDVLAPGDPLIRKAPKNVTAWAPPPVRLATGEMWSGDDPPPRTCRGWFTRKEH